VLRTFANSNVPHLYDSIDPNRDLDSLDAELAVTDLASVERRLERTARAAKSGDKKYQQELEILRLMQDALNDLKLVSQLELLPQDHAVLDELFLLTVKPRMYVLNVSEDVLGAANDLLERIAKGEQVDGGTLEGELKGIAAIAQRAPAEGAEVVAVSARLEAELAAACAYEAAAEAEAVAGGEHPAVAVDIALPICDVLQGPACGIGTPVPSSCFGALRQHLHEPAPQMCRTGVAEGQCDRRKRRISFETTSALFPPSPRTYSSQDRPAMSMLASHVLSSAIACRSA